MILKFEYKKSLATDNCCYKNLVRLLFKFNHFNQTLRDYLHNVKTPV